MQSPWFVTSLLLGTVLTVVTAEDRIPRLPEFTMVDVRTFRGNAGAMITAEYVAPEEPFVLWFVNDMPIPSGRVDYVVVNEFGGERKGKTIMSSLMTKEGEFGVCLLNTVGEICLTLAPLPPGNIVREQVQFSWPLMTPGPLARYREDKKLMIHAPVMDTLHNYTYSATLYSKNPLDTHGRLVEAKTRDMEGGEEGDVVTLGPVTRGTGWMLAVRTDLADYEGVMMVTTSYRPQSGLVKGCELFRPFTIYRFDHSDPFAPGFVAAVSQPVSWRCRRNMDCMVYCPFVSNGRVNVTISRLSITSVLAAEFQPGGLVEEEEGFVRMLGRYWGYGAVFIPAFRADRDAGTYKCTYRTANTMAVGTVEVY